MADRQSPPTARAAARAFIEDPDQVIALGVLIATVHPNDMLVATVRCGLWAQDARRVERVAVKQVHEDIVTAPIWRSWDNGHGFAASWIAPAKLERRRAVPGPLAREDGGAA